jgi:hypothetical protein
MGTRRRRQRQEELWYRGDLAEAPGHPFYRRLNEVFDHAGFDEFCEARCRKFYHQKLGRPSLARRASAEVREQRSKREQMREIASKQPLEGTALPTRDEPI